MRRVRGVCGGYVFLVFVFVFVVVYSVLQTGIVWARHSNAATLAHPALPTHTDPQRRLDKPLLGALQEAVINTGGNQAILGELVTLLEKRSLWSLEDVLREDQTGLLPIPKNLMDRLRHAGREGKEGNEGKEASQAVVGGVADSSAGLNTLDSWHSLPSSDPYIGKLNVESFGLETFQLLLEEANIAGHQWIWEETEEFPSVPYLIIDPEKEPKPPKAVEGIQLPPPIVLDEVARVTNLLKHRPKLAALFKNCYPNTLSTTTSLLDDGSTYVITGDIDLMWLRDSSAQVHQYFPLAHDTTIQRIVEGLIARQVFFIPKNPYGSSFRIKLRHEDTLKPFHTKKARNLYCAMHNYELDSLCYHIVLSYQWWRASGRTAVFTEEWLRGIYIILNLMVVEQNHETSPYRYSELGRYGKGGRTNYTGMSWCSHRPSDDQTQFGFLIPSNIMAVVAMGYLQEIAKEVYYSPLLEKAASKLKKEIDDGIHKFGVVNDPIYGKMYAYEVDGLGGANKMDDANVPSLLAIPYLNYSSVHDPGAVIAANTRKFVLSSANPFFAKGKYAEGIGSPHTGKGSVWPMSLIMQGLTTDSTSELDRVLLMLEETDADTNFMHESFRPDNPKSFSRTWFAWANSLFSELILNKLDYLSKPQA